MSHDSSSSRSPEPGPPARHLLPQWLVAEGPEPATLDGPLPAEGSAWEIASRADLPALLAQAPAPWVVLGDLSRAPAALLESAELRLGLVPHPRAASSWESERQAVPTAARLTGAWSAECWLADRVRETCRQGLARRGTLWLFWPEFPDEGPVGPSSERPVAAGPASSPDRVRPGRTAAGWAGLRKWLETLPAIPPEGPRRMWLR